VDVCPTFADDAASATNVVLFDNMVVNNQYFVFDLTLDANWQKAKSVLAAHVQSGGAVSD